MHRDLSTAFFLLLVPCAKTLRAGDVCLTPRDSLIPGSLVHMHCTSWMDTGQESVRDPGVQRVSLAALLPLIPLLGDGGGFEVGRKSQ